MINVLVFNVKRCFMEWRSISLWGENRVRSTVLYIFFKKCNFEEVVTPSKKNYYEKFFARNTGGAHENRRVKRPSQL